jgi:DNA-directed RNA polymerase subunit M/transcription elongation factor TFIIS
MIACAANYCPECGNELTNAEIEDRDRDYCSSCDHV